MSEASRIVAAVSNRFRDSDIRADNRTMITEFDKAFAAKDAEIAALRARLYEISGHLGAALMQEAASDDQIIMGHVRDAAQIAEAIHV